MTKDIELSDLVLLAKQTGLIQREGVFKQHTVASKGHTDDPVTETDKKCEEFVLDRLASIAPGHAIVTEESGIHSGDSEHVWYIDRWTAR